MSVTSLLAWLRRGFEAKPQTVLIIAGINTALAALMSIPDPRPFWHPLISVHCFGFSIAYFLNCVRPWSAPKSIRHLIFGVALGTLAGMILVILVKQYSVPDIIGDYERFAFTMLNAFLLGLLVSVFFHTRIRDTLASAALHQAESERERLGRVAAEAQLKLMQAQVEPHFLFNTLSNVQFLVETDPPRAAAMLEHLTQYLRAAIPQLREQSTTLGQEAKLVEAYLSIIGMRMGKRLAFSMELPRELQARAFPPMVLLSLVENAVKHGVEPAAAGGTITVSATRQDNRLCVSVRDNGRGLIGEPGSGVGLSNIRERLHVLYGGAASLQLSAQASGGTLAQVEIPDEPGTRAAG